MITFARSKQSMALIVHQTYQKNDTLLTLWEATESTKELLVLAELTVIEKKIFSRMHLEKRQREWLCMKILLRRFAADGMLSNLSNGKPVITGGRHISVSHSGNIAGVIFSDHNLGMDIQTPNEKLFHIASKFCNDKELKASRNHDQALEFLTMIWSAKEAVFKYYGERVHFAKDMNLQPFQVNDQSLIVDYTGVHGARTFQLLHMKLNDFHIIHTT